MRSKLIALAGATLFLAGACGGDDDSVADRDGFMSACTEATPEGAGVSDPGEYCGCIYDGLESTLSAEELEQLTSASPTEMPEEATNVITECATSAVSLPGTTVAP